MRNFSRGAILFLSAAAFLFLGDEALRAQSFSSMHYRDLGPYRGGRVTTVAGIASQPGTYYLGATGGGIWKTTDYGTSWKNVSDGFLSTPSIGDIRVSQQNSDLVYVGTGTDGLRSNVIEGKGMYKSADAGKSWSFIGLPEAGQIGAVRIHPEDDQTVYVAAIGKAFRPNKERGLYKTTNGGESWEQLLFVSEESGISDVELVPGKPNVILAAAWRAERKPWTIISGGNQDEGGIYKSTNGGANWTKIELGLPQELIGKIDIEISPSDPNIVYALVEAPGKEGGVYRSTNQGDSFMQVSDKKELRTRPFYYTNIKVDPTDEQVLYVMATRYFRSRDGGKTWKKVTPPHGDSHDMWIQPDNPDLFIQANDGGANVTHNAGETWSTQFNQGTVEVYQVEVDNAYPYWVYGGQQDNYSTITVPSQVPHGVQGGSAALILNTGGCETGPAVPDPLDPDIVYANCKGRFTVYNKRTGMEQSYYVGASNMYGHNPKDLPYRFQRVSPIHVSPHDPTVIYHASQFVHKTTNRGQTWTTISPDLTAFEEDKQVISGSPITRDITGEEFYSTIYALRESPLEAGQLWVGSNDGPVHLTQDGGQNWTDVTPSQLEPGGRVDAVEPSPHNPQKAYVAVLRYQLGDTAPYIFKTEDLGKSWTLISTGDNGIPADEPVRVIREDPEREGLLYAGTEAGVYVSFDDGKQWQPFQQNLPGVPITDMKIHRNDLVLSTMGRGFWVLEDLAAVRQFEAGSAAGDDAADDAAAPAEFALYKPSATVRYRYPSGADDMKNPSYPKPSVKIDYVLPEKVEQGLTLEILDASGQLVNRYYADSLAQDSAETKPASEGQADAAQQTERDMATGERRYLVEKKLKAEKGWNRFAWDMTALGPWHKKKKSRFKNGHLVPPGTYTLRLSYADAAGETQVQSTEVELLIDPRISDEGIDQATIDTQVALLKEISGMLSEVRHYIQDLEEELESEGLKKKRKKEIEALLDTLRTEEGTYMQPKLEAQIGYLYYQLNQADQSIGDDAMARYNEYKKRWAELK